MDNGKTSKIITETDKIGVIGSPSSTTTLSIDILGSAAKRKLIGELTYFPFAQDGTPHYAIGQVSSVELQNAFLQDSTMKNLIREKGQLDAISGLQDTFNGNINISAVFGEKDNKYFPSLLGTVPPTGTNVHLVTDEVLDEILAPYRDEIFYLGRVYGSTPKLPLWFKHFGMGKSGAGEAYHLGVFGKTGSGKSVLAKMILLGYARHPEMSIFIIDPQAEFAMDMKGGLKYSRFDLKLSRVLASLNKKVIVKSVDNLVLQGWPLFTEILRESIFFQKIGIKRADEKRIASEDITRILKDKFKTTDLVSKDVFFTAFKALGSESANERFQNIFKDFSYDQVKYEDLYATAWKPVCELFREREGGLTIGQIIQSALHPKENTSPVVVINLSGTEVKNIFWNEAIQSIVIKSFLDTLKEAAEAAYRNNQHLNSLVVLDEAHRLAPREETENEALESVRESLIDAVRTTRKYGLGWLFISQTLASLPKEIVEQLRILFFGFGLAFGNEFSALKELAGGDESQLRLYQTFRDPHSSFDVSTKQYNFMTIGPVSPLSFSGTPLFFTSYNDPMEYLKTNRFVRAVSKTANGATPEK